MVNTIPAPALGETMSTLLTAPAGVDHTGRRRPPLFWWLAAAVSIAVLLSPGIYLFVRSAEVNPAEWQQILFESRAGEYLRNSLVLSVTVSLTALVLGVIIAVGITRGFPRAQKPLLILSSLPLAIPSYMATYGWLVLSPSISGFLPAWLLLTAVTVPYVVLPTAARLRGMGGAPELVARTLGRSPLKAFLEATWPHIRPAALAGTLLVFLYSVSDFGLPALLRFHTLTWGVNAAYAASFNRNQAAILALLVVLLALIAVVGERRVRGVSPVASTGYGYAGPKLLGPVRGVFGLAISAPIAIGILVPFVGLGFRLFQAETLRETDWARLLEATWWTILVAVLAAVFATVVALPLAALAARYRGRAVRLFESLGYLSHSLPGIVLGLSLVFLSLRLVPSLYQSIAVLVFGYTVLFASKSLGTSRSSIEGVQPRLVMVARTLGETSFGAWRRVTLPLALPGIAVGALLVMISTMKELPATLILRPTGVNTLATELWTRTVAVEYAAAAPYAALLVLLAAIPAMFLSGIRGERGEAR